MRHIHLMTLLAALGTTGLANAAGWTVAEDSSSVTFTAEQQGSKFNGKFDTFTAEIEVPAHGANGTILAQGGRFGGWALYVKDGVPRPLARRIAYLLLLISACDITRAAELLGMKRPRLSQLVKQYELNKTGGNS